MSLATRCTACGTVFRVVQDQLKVSEGWVRCGRCNEVFNALEGLFDLERDTPPVWPSSVSGDIAAPLPPPPVPMPHAEGDQPVAPLATSAEAPDAPGPLDVPAMRPHDTGQHSTPAKRVSERDRLEFPDAQFDPDMLADEAVQAQTPPAELEPSAMVRDSELVDDPGAPAFVLHARRRARWNSPAMRALQGSVALILLAGLALQAVHHHRNVIAARWPGATPALTSWCSAVGCTVEAPRRIEDVAVENTALTRASAPDTFKLAVVLRNRGAMAVALPSIDLSLTDTSGQLVARRMLSPGDFRVASTVLKPGGEAALQLVLNAGSAGVTGYTVEVFYP